MYKLTAGIFAGILTIVTVNAARADIATTTYVQGGVRAANTYTDEKVGALADLETTAKTDAVAAINEVKGAVDTVAGNMVADANTKVAEADKTKKYGSIAYTEGLMEGYVAELGYDDKLDAQATEIQALKTKVGTETVASQITAEINKLNGDVTGTTGVVKTIAQENGKITATRAAIVDGDIAIGTIAKDKLVDAVQASLTKADNALPTATYNEQVGTVDKTNMGTTTATTVVGGIKEAIDAAKAAKDAAETAANTASDSYALKTEVGTVSTLTTDAKTVVGAVNELDKDIADMDSAYKAADKAIADQIGTGFTAENTVAKAIENAKTAAADSVDEKLESYSTTEQMNSKLAEKMNIDKSLAGKTLTTNATTGLLEDAATTVAGEKPTCNAETDGDDCEVVLMSTGTGFKWTKIVNTYK